MPTPDPILSRLTDQRDALRAALTELALAGLDTTPAASMARRYIGRIERAMAPCPISGGFYGVAGMSGENGWAPAVRSILADARFELTRLAPVTWVSPTQVAA